LYNMKYLLSCTSEVWYDIWDGDYESNNTFKLQIKGHSND
jgi:hypothetical protein